ncbi:MAG: tetratricopeptide repeat-containing sensor histidine kinase, partial [Sphingomonas sp.]
MSSAFGLLFLALVNVPASGTSAAPVVASVGGTADDRKFDAMVAQAKDAMLSSPAQAEAIGRAAEEFSKTAPTLSNRVIAIATAEWLEGEAYIRQNKIDMAAPYISRALQKAISYRKITPLLGNILLSKGWISTSKPDVAQALDDYQRAYRVFQTVNDRRNRSIALLSIASLYKEAKDYDNAEKYYKQALDDVASDPKMLVAIYNNRGNVQKEAAKYEGAIEQFKQALLIARSLKSPSLEAQVLRNLARAQLGAGQVSDADASIRRGIQLARASGDPSAEEQFWNVAALAAFEEGRIGEARSLIGRVFAGLDLTQTRLSFRESHETAFKIYQRAGDQKLALAHLMALKRLDDQATQLAASTNTSLMAAKFDYANQDLKIAQLRRAEAQRSLELERSRARFQRILFAGSAIAALIVFGMLGFGIVTLRRSRNEVRAANIDLAASNSALEKALAAKTEFLATTSHEIRTPLNGILGM